MLYRILLDTSSVAAFSIQPNLRNLIESYLSVSIQMYNGLIKYNIDKIEVSWQSYLTRL